MIELMRSSTAAVHDRRRLMGGYLPASLRTILAMIPVSRPVTRLGLMMSGAAARCRRAIFMAVGWLSAIASPALRRRNRYRRFSHNETS